MTYSQIDIKSKIQNGPIINIKGRHAHKSKVCSLTETTLPEPILVGRKTELEELKRFLDLTFIGNGTTVFISGKAGRGKTRLINEFLTIVKEREINILSGSCLSNATLPYFPFIEAFSSDLLSREDGTLVSQQSSMRSWLLESYSNEKLEKNKISAPQVWKDQAFASVTRELLFMASIKPLILILEDIHWADSASLALLHYISRAISNEKILVLATFRSEELGKDPDGRRYPLVETIQLMGREGLFKEIKLANLDNDGVRGIAESMLNGKVSRELVDRLTEESQGNPLFVVEFLRMLSEEGILVRENNKWRGRTDKLGIPSKVRDIIVRRIYTLNPDQRRVLDVASVIGDKFNPDLIGAVLSKGRLEILEVLNRVLKSTSLVRVEGNLFMFDHAKSREVLYSEISMPLKQGYHQRIAEQLETSSKASKEAVFSDLAYHYAKAGNKEKSLKYSLAAGQDALARFGNAEAIKHFKYVLESVANQDELSNERNIALEGLGDAYAANCMYEEAIMTFGKLADLETGSLRLRALRKAMDAAFIKGDKPDLLLEYAKKAEELDLDDPLEMARVIKNRGRAFNWAGRGEKRMDLEDYEKALQIFEEENSLDDVAEALWRSGEAQLSFRDLYEKGLGNLLRARSIFRELGEVRKEIAVTRAIGNAFLSLGLFPEAKQELADVLRFGEKIGLFNELARAYGILGFMDEYEGNIENALPQVLKALKYIEKTDVKYVQAFDLGALTRIYSKLGDLKRADEYYKKMVNLSTDVLSTWLVRFNFILSKGVYFAAKGKFEESNQIFETVALNLKPPFIADYIWVLEKQGRIEEAKVQRDKAQNVLEQTQKCFEHVNVHLSVMMPRRVNVGDIFEMRFDLVNVSKNPSTLIKVDGLVPSGCRVVSIPSFCSLQNGSIKIANEQINPFQVDTIKIKASFEEAGVYKLDPCIYYKNELGDSRTDNAKPIFITVQLGPDEEKGRNVTELLTGKIEFKSEAAEKSFDFLVKAFIEDFYGRRLPKEKSGWRTRMDVIRNANVTMHSIYGRSGRGGKVTSKLTVLGLVESRFFLGERGRGGNVLKMRICYEKECVKNLISQRGDNNNSKDRTVD